MKPFLRWAGNKFPLIDKIKDVLPDGKRLIEPFAGAGAVFLNTQYNKYILAEQNLDLVNLYLILQREGDEFIEYCRSFFFNKLNCAEEFYRLRYLFNQGEIAVRHRAALFLYLNKHCYNGLCRYNASGYFNVPFGKQKKGYFPAKEMRYFHDKAKNAEFWHADFLMTMDKAKKGDVVYCDPPYVPLSDTANFCQYGRQQFTENQHLALVNKARELGKKGIPVIISNHDTPFVRKHYAQAKLKSFSVARYISCNTMTRNKAPEVLAIFS